MPDYSGEDDKTTNSDEIDLLSLVKVLFKRKIIIIVVCFLAGGVSVVYALLQTPRYEVTTRFIYQSADKTSGMNMMAIASMVGLGGIDGEADPSVYLEDILLSTSFLGYLVKRQWPIYVSSESQDTVYSYLHDVWEMKPDTLASNWQHRFYLSKLGNIRDGGYISYSKNRQSGVISVTTTFESPLLAYTANLFIFEKLNDKLLYQMVYKARENREFIQERLAEVSTDLVRSENRLKNFRERNLVISSPQLMLEEGRFLRDVQINQEMFLQLRKQYEMARIEEIKYTPVLEIISHPLIPVEKSEPQRRRIVMMGGGAGFFLGIVAAFLFEWWALNKKRLFEVIKNKKDKADGE